jgi:cephalosporin hydroxylase
MRRLFWMGVGAAAGVYAVRKVQKILHSYSPSGLAERAEGVGASLRYFADEVRAGMTARELELRDALGLGDGARDLPPGEAAQLIEHPTRHRRSAG